MSMAMRMPQIEALLLFILKVNGVDVLLPVVEGPDPNRGWG